MTSPDLIDPAGIPQFTGDIEQLGLDAVTLGAEASIFRFSGAQVHSTFQGLSAFYAAPEADQLFATTAPVAIKSDAFADDLEKVGAALSAYEDEIRPLVAKLKRLEERATSFRADIAGDDHWREDDDNVSLNNDLVHDVNTTTAAFWQAEVTCHNKITALVGGTTLIMEDGAAKRWLNRDQSLYGFTADVLEQSQDLPWGKTVEKERHGLDWLGHEMGEFGKGFVVDGVWGTVKGLGTLVGFNGLDAMGQAWYGLGKLATGVLISATPLGYAYWMLPDDKLPSYLRESRDTVIETGKALVAYDQWGTNPARASGAVTFNVLTTVFSGGAGAAAKGGAAARTVAVLGKAGKLVDPLTYIGKAAKFGTVKVADLFTSLKGIRAGTSVDIAGHAYQISDQAIGLPERVGVLPENTVRLVDPEGRTVYLDRESGELLDEHGKVLQNVGEIPKEASAAQRASEEPGALPQREHVLAGGHAEGNTSGAVGRAGDNVSTPANSEFGQTSSHQPRGSAHDIGRGPSNSHEAPVGSSHDTSTPHGASGTADTHGAGGHAGSADGHGGASDSGTGASHGPEARSGTGQGAGDHGASEHPLTEAEKREIIRKQVARANADSAWREKYYEPDGTRRSIRATDENGHYLPKLRRNPESGEWYDPSSRAAADPEKYLPIKPVEGSRATVNPQHIDRLDDSAAHRKASIELGSAERAYKNNPTAANASALEEAQKAFGSEGKYNTGASEKYGEDVTRYHAIPENFPNATEVTPPGTGNRRFDHIYENGDRHLLVESKAPSGTLNPREGVGAHSGALVMQGTREYVVATLSDMVKRPKERMLALKLLEQLEAGKLDYILVKATENPGRHIGYIMKHFNIG